MSLIGQKVTVLGGGIGGLAAARALALRGAEVRVLEQAAKIAEVGAGLQISPNGIAVLRGLGLEEAVTACARRAEAIQLRNYRGAPVLRMALPQGDARGYYLMHRADLIDLLAKGARDAGVEIVLGAKVTEITLDPTVLRFEDRQTETPDLLIGADGINSVLRPALNGAAKPFFTGQVAWRALVPTQVEHPPIASLYMGPGCHLVTYPLRDRKLMNIVAVQERDEWAAEGWANPDDPANLRAAFSEFAPEVQALLARVESVKIWGLFRHPVASTWHNDNAALLGDAAHPTLPFMAQGANMALEDAWVLADALAGSADTDAGLMVYQARRHLRAAKVIAAANANARNYHLSFPPLRAIAHTILRTSGRLAPQAALKRFDWIYQEDVTKA
ncbi:FAD-dependent monooxygenase [Cognatishimia sp. MH4019]|uniref:FAD-dependent monooxygenase n=1 Tax=Cognatishimia sp. MH4019 TaxID=2854030 RepID=UPI001CD41F30|nr:FAD-dependent monooxygenase [Cognatishimia sp. MH4019]